MSTLVLNAYSKAYPSVTNRIRASIYYQTDPQALIATIIHPAPHPIRTWSFPGLPRQNYGFSLDEIDGSDNVVSNKALFDVVPGEIDGELCRADEQIKVGTTAGFTAGVNTATFDGTSGKPNYIGWDIVPSELTGRGILAEGLDYSWDSVTGIFTLLQALDVFAVDTIWNIHFNCNPQVQGNSYPSIIDFSILFKTANYTIVTGDFGSKIICEPAGGYMELTLPAIATVPQGRMIMIEVGGTGLNTVKLIPGATPIKFLRGNVFINSGETISIYKFMRSVGVFEWRVMNAYGNYNSVGQIVSEDMIQADVFNKQLLDGSVLPATCRLYQEVVLHLPVGQVVAYSAWSTGDNSKYYSLVDSVSGNFHVPDRRNLFERGTTAGTKAGDYQADDNKQHDHYVKTGGDNDIDDVAPPNGYIHGRNNPDSRVNPSNMGDPSTYNCVNHFTTKSGGTESRPKNYSINKYVLL